MSRASILCATVLASFLFSTTTSAAPMANNTNHSLRSRSPVSRRALTTPDDDGWIHFDSFGLMLPMGSSQPEERDCETVECHQHVQSPPSMGEYVQRSDVTAPVKFGSRDIIRKRGIVTMNPTTGQPNYTLIQPYESPSSSSPSSSSSGRDDPISRSLDRLARLLRRKTSSKSKSKSKAKTKKTSSKSKKTSSSKNALAVAVGNIMKGATILTTITWYTGHDLLNPYCDRKSKWTPTDDSLIIAVTEKWSLRPACGEFLEIVTTDKSTKKQRSVTARVVDLCGGCIPEVPHADLSKAAFTKLYDLDVGRVQGLKMRRVSAPKKWSNKLYGPKTL